MNCGFHWKKVITLKKLHSQHVLLNIISPVSKADIIYDVSMSYLQPWQVGSGSVRLICHRLTFRWKYKKILRDTWGLFQYNNLVYNTQYNSQTLKSSYVAKGNGFLQSFAKYPKNTVLAGWCHRHKRKWWRTSENPGNSTEIQIRVLLYKLNVQNMNF